MWDGSSARFVGRNVGTPTRSDDDTPPSTGRRPPHHYTSAVTPPKKLSELLQLAINDASLPRPRYLHPACAVCHGRSGEGTQVCLDRDTYIPDAGTWHEPQPSYCFVCVAGAVLSPTLGISPRAHRHRRGRPRRAGRRDRRLGISPRAHRHRRPADLVHELRNRLRNLATRARRHRPRRGFGYDTRCRAHPGRLETGTQRGERHAERCRSASHHPARRNPSTSTGSPRQDRCRVAGPRAKGGATPRHQRALRGVT